MWGNITRGKVCYCVGGKEGQSALQHWWQAGAECIATCVRRRGSVGCCMGGKEAAEQNEEGRLKGGERQEAGGRKWSGDQLT